MMGIVLSRMFEDEVEAEKIGRFILLDRLGEGGMGVVYAAYDDQLDRRVAVKVLRSWIGGSDPLGPTRLLNEARAMARLSHPNIVTVHEVGTVNDDVFVAMEHVRGQSLDRWLEGPSSDSAPRPWREVVKVFAAAGRGLAAAHRAGIVHRDFKPHNAILDDEGVVKVLDFGLARVLDASPASHAPHGAKPASPSSRLTRTGAIMGTPAYMAPEQHEGATADERSDQFSFFASLYHVLYRQLPFDVVHGEVRTPPTGSSVPRWLHRALLVGLRTDPEERYRSMPVAIAAITRDPAARRRRWLWLGGFGLAVASVSVAVASRLGPADRASCDQGTQRISRVWDDEARAELKRGLSDSGLPFPDETWDRLGPRLDTYAEAWASQRDDACAAHRDGSHSAALYDLRVVCLEQRREAFASLVELVSQADRETAGRALSAAAALPTLRRCADTHALLAAVPPPPDPLLSREVEAQRRTLARVRELEMLGQYELGIEEARAIVELAEQLEYRPLLAESMVRLASLTMEHGSALDAERWLTEALTHALASAHFEIATEATALRIFVRAERLRTPERASDDVALGAGLIERPGIGRRLQGLYLNNVGAYYIRREDYGAARRWLIRALEIKRQGPEPNEPEIAYTLGNLSIVEQYAGHEGRARAYLDEAFEIAQRALGPHHTMTAEFARLRGELLFRMGYPRAARIALESVLATLQETTDPRSPLPHAPLVMLGEIALTERRYTDALQAFQRAAALELPGEMYRLLEEVGIARSWGGLGQEQRSGAGFERALALATGDLAAYESMVRELYAHLLLRQGHPSRALIELQRAAELEIEAQGQSSPALASVLETRGEALRLLERFDDAEATLGEALSILEQDTGPWPRERAAIHRQRALVSLTRGQRAPSIMEARAAIDALESWGDPNNLDHSLARVTLARALMAGTPNASDRHEAERLAHRARTAFEAQGTAFAEEIAELDTLERDQIPHG